MPSVALDRGMLPPQPAAPLNKPCRINESYEMIVPLELAKSGLGLSGYTTVVIKHIPEHYSQSGLLSLFISRGLADQFDYFFLPAHSSHGFCNCGYAFLNFLTPEFAEIFYSRFNGSFFQTSDNIKRRDAYDKGPIAPLAISPAHVQGLYSNAVEYLERRQVEKKGRYKLEPLFLDVPDCFAYDIQKFVPLKRQQKPEKKTGEQAKYTILLGPINNPTEFKTCREYGSPGVGKVINPKLTPTS